MFGNGSSTKGAKKLQAQAPVGPLSDSAVASDTTAEALVVGIGIALEEVLGLIIEEQLAADLDMVDAGTQQLEDELGGCLAIHVDQGVVSK